MKALIGLATAAIAVFTTGGIKAALPSAPTGFSPWESEATQVRVTAVVDGDTLRVKDLGAARSAHSACSDRLTSPIPH